MAKSISSGPSYLGQRLDWLRACQNADGGWGYFPRKTSWLEPTAYAAMALHGEPAADRAWQLLSSWQIQSRNANPSGEDGNGGWRSSASLLEPGWGTSLCVSLGLGRGESTPAIEKGIEWLVNSVGAETNWLQILAGMITHERNFRLKAWPWKPGDSGWMEPTAHALIALKQAARKPASATNLSAAMESRIQSGEAQLLDVRCGDGGWNYGARETVGMPLPSYPETTALALVALQGRADLAKAFDLAARQLQQTPSPLARAWLTIALRVHEAPVETQLAKQFAPALTDVMISALEALGAPEGNIWFLQTTAGKKL